MSANVWEEYTDLEPGQMVLSRRNDAYLPIGLMGTVVRRIPETGCYQCRFEVEGQARIVALTPDQVRPAGSPAPNRVEAMLAERRSNGMSEGLLPVQFAGDDDKDDFTGQQQPVAAEPKRTRGWSDEARAAQAERMRQRAAERKAAKAESGGQEPERRDVPRTVRAVKPEVAAARVPVTVADVPLSIVTSPAPEPTGQGFAATFLAHGAGPETRDWLREGATALRRVIGAGAASASVRELGLLLEAAKYLEEAGA